MNDPEFRRIRYWHNEPRKVIGFLSAKGGCGATTLACHVAWELQNQTRKRVLLADLDLTSGLVGFLMKTPSSYSILDAVKNLSRLDESLWKALIVENRPNLSVIPAPASYSRWDHPDENQLKQILQFMRTQHDWIVLDLGRSLNSIATAVLDEIDQLFLVSTLEVVALHGLKSIVHGLFDQGEKLQLVLNRTPKLMDISTQELEKILGPLALCRSSQRLHGLISVLFERQSFEFQYPASATLRIAGVKNRRPAAGQNEEEVRPFRVRRHSC